MTGRRSVHRDIEIPENFDEWPQGARIQYVRSTMKRPKILEEILRLVEADDQDVNNALTKDQAASVYLVLADLIEGSESEGER